MGRAHIKTKLAQLKSPRPKQRKRTHWSLFTKTSPFHVNIKRRKSNTATSSSAKPSAYKYLLSSALTAPPSLSVFRLLALRVCVCVSFSLSILCLERSESLSKHVGLPGPPHRYSLSQLSFTFTSPMI